MSALGGMRFYTREFEKGVKDLHKTVVQNTAVYGDMVGRKYQKDARENAKWKNQRGVARRGIFYSAKATETKVKVSMGMKALNYKKRGPRSARDYGEYLEFGHYGKFATIYPTIEGLRRSIIENFGKAALYGETKVFIERDEAAARRRAERYRQKGIIK